MAVPVQFCLNLARSILWTRSVEWLAVLQTERSSPKDTDAQDKEDGMSGATTTVYIQPTGMTEHLRNN